MLVGMRRVKIMGQKRTAGRRIIRKVRKPSGSAGVEKGYFKFTPIPKGKRRIPANQLTDINNCRNILFKLGLIGIYTSGPSKGVGFGNVSKELASGNIIVTGNKTGGIRSLTQDHYCLVTRSFPSKNRVWFVGPIIPTSESMTHSAVYNADKTAKVVLHVHNLRLWRRLLNKVPTTRENVTYGTPAMAGEVTRLFKETDVGTRKIFVTAGHTEGVFVFGRNFKEALNILLGYYGKRKA